MAPPPAFAPFRYHTPLTLCRIPRHVRAQPDPANVNHVPVLTGGSGKAALREFYGRDFIPRMPPDFAITSISRTVGADSLVDEMLTTFTHSVEMPWMLPGVAPTNCRVEIAIVAIVHFRDGKLAHEHIYWDPPSVLKQIGLLTDPTLPVFGAETARKVIELGEAAGATL